jgi:hypothetical protein
MGWTSAPDTSKQDALAAQNADVAKEGLAFAKQQYADQKASDAEYDPMYKAMMQASIDSSKLTAEQSAAQWTSYETLFQPLEKKMADTAANYDTPEREAAAAAQARGDVDVAAAAARAGNERALARSGIAPGSARAESLNQDAALDQAKMGAAAATGARRQQETLGLSLVDNAAKFGRGMTSTGLQAAQLSSSQNTAGAGLISSQAAIEQSAGAAMQGAYGQTAQINSGAAQIYGQSAATKAQANASASQGIGALAGVALTVF